MESGQEPRREGGSGDSATEKPVRVGEELDVTISEMSRRGDGVVRVHGYVIFIPAGRTGQQAKIRITAVRPNFATAEILNPGPV